MEKHITLAHGGGGSQSEELIQIIQKHLSQKTNWQNLNDDGATLRVRPLLRVKPYVRVRPSELVFTTDSFIIDPLFFQGGDIGKIAACGTINDLTVMGAKPIGLSLSLILEEGLLLSNLIKIIKSIKKICQKENTPVVTGDTKVMEKGKLDKIAINTTGIGLAKKVITDNNLKPGDLICSNGYLGDHGAVILANRFNYQTNLKSDCATFYQIFSQITPFITASKDPTRGGLAQCLNEMAEKSKVKIIIDQKINIFRKEALAISNLLGISQYSLPSEGRFVFGIKEKDKNKVAKIFKKSKQKLIIFGQAKKGKDVIIKTRFGQTPLEKPEGKLLPRIC